MLLTHISRTGFEILEQNGAVVFPLRDEHEVTIFEALNRRYVQSTANPVLRPSPTSQRSGIVLGVEPGSERAARLYAHLTGRRFRSVAEVPLPLDDDVQVLVLPYEYVSHTLLHNLYVPGMRRAPGLITGRNEEEMRMQVLCRAAALVLPVPDSREPFHIDVFAGDPLPEEDLSTRLLSLRTHSDGIDAALISGAVCTLKDTPLPNFRHPPSCIVHRYCHRLERPLEEALASDDLLPPTVLTGRVVVLRMCWGIVPNPSMVDSSWAFAHRLFTSPKVGTVITSWEIIGTQLDELAPFMIELANGAKLGEALAAANTSWEDSGTRMALFGDPELVMPLSLAP